MALTDNLLRAYRINSSVYEDESGNGGADGINIGGPITTGTGDGGEDFFEYNGSSQVSYMPMPSTNLFDSDYTIAVRFASTGTPGTTEVIAGLGSSSNNFPAFIIRGNGNEKLQGWLRDDTAGITKQAISTGDVALYNGTERIAVLTYNKTADSIIIKELTLGLSGSDTGVASSGSATFDRSSSGAWMRAAITWPWSSDNSWVATWDRALTAQDETDLLVAPWPFVTGPSITSITDPAITGSIITTLGSGFGAAQGTGGTTQAIAGNTVALTETAWADGSVTSTSAIIEAGPLKYGDNTLELTADGGGSDTITFEAIPLANNDYVDLTVLLLLDSYLQTQVH